jgi:NADPH-dependent 2,4-dienoyl-CoA reductase/sulfur reductase-like enzyme/peroxiredoxin family protein/rhodanese-related sulfurtransferase/TusA-related sulfurtransferase
MKKIVIVGGVAGGATCAARLRRLNEDSEIIMFEKGKYISFANCGLPYFIGDTIKERDRLLLQTPEGFRARFNIDVRIKSKVKKIDRKNKTVLVISLDTGEEYEESYDQLVLSPGSSPVRPPLPGIDGDRIYTLRTVPDAEKIKSFVDEKKPKRAVVVGAGFIGLEMAENLHDRGLHVTVVEKLDQVMATLDFEMANIITQHMKLKGINFILGSGISGFENGVEFKVSLDDGRVLSSDLAILSIGVRPESMIASEAGLDVMERGGAIVVDDQMRTNDPDIFAIGDAVVVKNPILDKKWVVALAGPANRQARLVADIIEGGKEKYPGTIGTSILKIFDVTAASVGCTEKYLKAEGVKYEKIYTHTGNHVGYYPGATIISTKLLFRPEDGQILGSQMIGSSGVDRRIDIIATAMRLGAGIEGLKNLELAYAPPYGAAKDPINVTGLVAENLCSGKTEICHWHDIEKIQKDPQKYFLLDVRTEDEFFISTINGSINIPVDEIRSRLDEIPRDKTIVLFCQVGLRGYVAERMLRQKGFTAINLSGGYKSYVYATDRDMYNFTDLNEVVESDDMSEIEHSSAKMGENKISVNACGLSCPGPIKILFERMKELSNDGILEISVTDAGFINDVKAWCQTTGNELISVNASGGEIKAIIKKRSGGLLEKPSAGEKDEQTIVVFSGHLDKVIAAFIIATGAASMGKKVNMFFTFWGLNALRKDCKGGMKKDFISKMFGLMMPCGADKLTLSKMHMGGMGTSLMKRVMKGKQVDSLPELIKKAMGMGVKIVACQMSLDVMGLKKEEFMDGVEVGGVASFLADSDRSNSTLFI